MAQRLQLRVTAGQRADHRFARVGFDWLSQLRGDVILHQVLRLLVVHHPTGTAIALIEVAGQAVPQALLIPRPRFRFHIRGLVLAHHGASNERGDLPQPVPADVLPADHLALTWLRLRHHASQKRATALDLLRILLEHASRKLLVLLHQNAPQGRPPMAS